MPFEIIKNDITKVDADVIVNSANEKLQLKSGVCGAIFAAAGEKELQMECSRIGGCKIGEAVLTRGYKLKAKYIIHTAGPVWKGGKCSEEEMLKKCYYNSLKLAIDKKCESIAMPLISTGNSGYPREKVIKIALNVIKEVLKENELKVYLVVFDSKKDVMEKQLHSKINKYIGERFVEKKAGYEEEDIPEYKNPTASVFESTIPFNEKIVYNGEDELLSQNRSFDYVTLFKEGRQIDKVTSDKFPKIVKRKLACRKYRKKRRRLEDMVKNIDETFSQMLLRLIDEKGMTDVETYKKANIDRKLFSKIKNLPTYNPSKTTAIAFAIALELEIDETKDLLLRAGYALSRSNKFDIIIEYFIEQGNYDVYEINEALFEFDQNLLGV